MLGVGRWVGEGGWRPAPAQTSLLGSESGPQRPQQDTRRTQAWHWDSLTLDGAGTGRPPWHRPPVRTVVSGPNLTTPSAFSSGFLAQTRRPRGWGSCSCFGYFMDRQEPDPQTTVATLSVGPPPGTEHAPPAPPCCPSIIPHPPVTSGSRTQAPSLHLLPRESLVSQQCWASIPQPPTDSELLGGSLRQDRALRMKRRQGRGCD